MRKLGDTVDTMSKNQFANNFHLPSALIKLLVPSTSQTRRGSPWIKTRDSCFNLNLENVLNFATPLSESKEYLLLNKIYWLLIYLFWILKKLSHIPLKLCSYFPLILDETEAAMGLYRWKLKPAKKICNFHFLKESLDSLLFH